MHLIQVLIKNHISSDRILEIANIIAFIKTIPKNAKSPA